MNIKKIIKRLIRIILLPYVLFAIADSKKIVSTYKYNNIFRRILLGLRFCINSFFHVETGTPPRGALYYGNEIT